MERRGSRLSRRAFVGGAAGLGLVAGCGRLPWQAQEPLPKAARIGYLGPSNPTGPYFEPFRQELRVLGYVEGQNLVIEARSADGSADRLPELAAELAALPVEVIATAGNPATRAARGATGTIPIVQVGGQGDLVALGLIERLSRPGGNVTGVTEMGPELNGKRLELLKQTVPALSRVAILMDEFGRPEDARSREYTAAAQTLEVQIQNLRLRANGGVDDVFATAARDGVDGLVVQPGAATFVNAELIAERAVRSRLPSIADRRQFVAAGSLMAYGPNFSDTSRRAAHLVDKILKGASPGDIPVENPMTFDFVVNLKTARELGITFPNEIMLQVTEVIQ